MQTCLCKYGENGDILIILFVIVILGLIGITIYVSLMYDIYVEEPKRTPTEIKCYEIKERLKWLNWKLQEQKSKEENSS